MNYKINKRAATDMESTWLYTPGKWSKPQADRYVNLILDEIGHPAENRSSGKDYSFLRPNYRCSRVKAHIIFFRIDETTGGIEVIRILHERMILKVIETTVNSHSFSPVFISNAFN